MERFVTVGEQIAEENEDVANEMREACEEAKKSGQAILNLTSSAGAESTSGDDGVNLADKNGMVRAARSLLSAVTRVLIIADSVVVKRLLKAVKKVKSLQKSRDVSLNFMNFVSLMDIRKVAKIVNWRSFVRYNCCWLVRPIYAMNKKS